MTATFARLLLALLALAIPVHAQNAELTQWLTDYAAGKHAEVAERLKSVGSMTRLESDLETIKKDWVKKEPVDQRLRELAAFALEAGLAQARQGPAAGKVVEWGCLQIRRISKPGEFERRWHLAAFSAFGGAIDPDNLERHVGLHMRLYPDEPRLLFEKALASELRAADVFTKRKVSASEVEDRNAEAAKRYRAATASADASVQAEAWLRLGRVELARGRLDAAMSALDTALPMLTDAGLRYLGQLFRGMTLERLKQFDAARQAFQAALAISPGAHSASMALAAMLVQHGKRVEADRIVTVLMARPLPATDPWMYYWPGDFRFGVARVEAMREVLR